MNDMDITWNVFYPKSIIRLVVVALVAKTYCAGQGIMSRRVAQFTRRSIAPAMTSNFAPRYCILMRGGDVRTYIAFACITSLGECWSENRGGLRPLSLKH